jgi:hypothetical protein
MTVTIKPDHRGEHEISRKTIARGMPGVSGVTVVTNARVYYHYTRGCGRIGRPAFPAPSVEGETSGIKLGRIAPRECGIMSAVIARSEATKQSILSCLLFYGLLRGACHRARIRATRWLAMTVLGPSWLVAIRIRYLRSPRIIAAPFSAIIAVGVLVFPEVIVGITDASATRSPAIP